MFVYLVFLFTVVPAVELAILIKLGTVIGVTNTLLVIILTGVLGAALARLQGFSVLRRIQESMNHGIMPTEEMLDGVMILIGGIVLLTPGLVTDIMGFLLLIPLTRRLIKAWASRKIRELMARGEIRTVHRTFRRMDLDESDDADFH